MDLAEELRRSGGVATRAQLLRLTSRKAVDSALATGVITALERGRYALPEADEARSAAHALSGVLCLTSAALLWGWAVKIGPSEYGLFTGAGPTD